MQVTLKRGTPIEFTFESADGTRWQAEVPAITVGQYRAAIALEADQPDADPVARLVKQAHILCGAQHEAFVDSLDAEQLGECVQALIALYAGLDPQAVVEVQRALKKKSLMDMLSAAQGQSSANSTS